MLKIPACDWGGADGANGVRDKLDCESEKRKRLDVSNTFT